MLCTIRTVPVLDKWKAIQRWFDFFYAIFTSHSKTLGAKRFAAAPLKKNV